MKIYRSILLNDGEKINTNNIGTSWTLDEIFAIDHAEDINGAKGKDGYVILEAEVDIDDVDISNTLFAMEDRPNEYEVVLNCGNIEAEVIHNEWTDIEEGEVVSGKVGGNSFEDYNSDYNGELTREDFTATGPRAAVGTGWSPHSRPFAGPDASRFSRIDDKP